MYVRLVYCFNSNNKIIIEIYAFGFLQSICQMNLALLSFINLKFTSYTDNLKSTSKNKQDLDSLTQWLCLDEVIWV